jgi:hypothetical protein
VRLNHRSANIVDEYVINKILPEYLEVLPILAVALMKVEVLGRFDEDPVCLSISFGGQA